MALTNKFSVVALALAAGLVAAPAAFAQDEQQPAQSAPADQSDQPAAVQPTDEQVDSFVKATVRIITIQQEAQKEMTATEEQEKQKQVRDEALQMIVAAVEEEGLSVEEYNGIVQKVETDPEFGETVQQRIQEQVAE
jgi:pentose-5-phosphate-3-epimerase